MNNYIPNMYCQSILDINYDVLKNKGIKYLLFDFDNTIVRITNREISKEFVEKINELKKNFQVIVISNNFSRKIKEQCSKINISFISFAMKPLPLCYKKVLEKYKCSKIEMCMIGDQLMTDIYGANTFGIFSILVDPLEKKELQITKINRYIEAKIVYKLSRLGILKRGKYYE